MSREHSRERTSRPDAGDPDPEELERVFEATLGVPFTRGNRLTPLRNGSAFFPAMLEAIEAARQRIRLLTFVYWKGRIARRFADALAGKAREGLQVQVLLDALGCMPMPEDLRETMLSAGVDLRDFRPLGRFRLTRVDNRTHRKVLACDGVVGFTGGAGIAEEWEGDARGPEEWRDTHLRVEGRAVRGLEGAFLDNWLEAGGPLDAPAHVPAAAEPGRATVQVLRSHGLSDNSDVLTATRLLLRVARRRVRIQTAYFVPDEAMREELCRASERGVQVEVMLPGRHTDHRLCNLAGRTEFEALLEAGVRLWLYDRTMLHTKAVTVDERLSFVGSPNFNQRSFHKDDELALIVLDRDLARTLDRHFEDDLRSARRLDPAEWPERGAWARAKERLASLGRPQL